MKNLIIAIVLITIYSCSKSNDATPANSTPATQTVTILTSISNINSQYVTYVNGFSTYIQDLVPITLKKNDSVTVELNIVRRDSQNDFVTIKILDGSTVVAQKSSDPHSQNSYSVKLTYTYK